MPLAFGHLLAMIYSMPLPIEPVTLSVEEVAELKQLLSTMRHDVNNHLSLMMAAVELIRRKPESAERMWKTMSEQPAKITDAIAEFSHKIEIAVHLRKD
jgi:aspartokinase